MKINNWGELKNIAINHSSDIDYNNILKFTVSVQKNRILF